MQVRRSWAELGRLETAVLGVVAAADRPVSVAHVQSQLPDHPAYTTVMSTLSRLADKGALTRSRRGRAYLYELSAPAGSIGDALTARQMRRLMSEGGHRDAVLARFVADLDPDEERLLTELLARSHETDADQR